MIFSTHHVMMFSRGFLWHLSIYSMLPHSSFPPISLFLPQSLWGGQQQGMDAWDEWAFRDGGERLPLLPSSVCLSAG